MLDDLLAGLRAGGSPDSPGFFTISREEMLRKLAPRPFGALPWLVKAALDGGATYLRVLRLARELLLEFDGRPARSLDPDHPSDLVLGLHVAARQGVIYQGGGQSLTAGPGRWKVRPAPRQPQQQVRLSCEPGHDGLFYWLDRMRLAPVPVEFEGEPWSVASLGGDFMARRTTENAQLYLGRSMFANVRPGRPPLILVLGGISIAREPAWPEAHVVARPVGLRRTLEGDEVVEDDAYRALLAELYATLQDMARELVGASAALPRRLARALQFGVASYLTSESESPGGPA